MNQNQHLMNDLEYSFLQRAILRHTKIDIANYKSQQMRRRLNGHINGVAQSVAEYCKLLERDKSAIDRLRNFLTINVSEFFRDPDQFDKLHKQVLPMLLDLKRSLRVWSAGCSIGAEPYSVAMMLEELAPHQSHSIQATDIDQTILAKARNGGPYLEGDLHNLPRRHLLKYFDKADKGYRVGKYLRSKVEFSQHDLLNDKFGHGFDLLMCRNVIIYFTDESKKKLFTAFRDSLSENGVLFIGATEALLDAKSLGLKRLDSCFYVRDTCDLTLASAARTSRNRAERHPTLTR